MKVELIQYYVKEDALDFYTNRFSSKYPGLGIYLGQDEGHVWIQPLCVVDSAISNPKWKVGILSVSRYRLDDVVLFEPQTYNDAGPYGDMVYQGKSSL